MTMPNKPSLSVAEQVSLLKSRGMLFRDEIAAQKTLTKISYYRLKGYWWDMQSDYTNHIFQSNNYFEDVIDRYNFDRELRLVLFDAVAYIEIALRTKLIYYLSQSFGGLWYLDVARSNNQEKHALTVADLKNDFQRSRETFAQDFRKKHTNTDPDAWVILEVASMGTLSKIYKNLTDQLPVKSKIAHDFALNSHKELSGVLEAVVFVRNIIAHHARLWNRDMVKNPTKINSPRSIWLTNELKTVQIKKPFLTISAILYLCNAIEPTHQVKQKLLNLFEKHPNVPIYKMGFLNNWQQENLWK